MQELMKILTEQKSAFGEFSSSIQKRIYDLETKAARPGGLGTTGDREDNSEHRKAYNAFLRKGTTDHLASFQKGMSVGTDADGGFLVPETIDKEIGRVERDATPMRQVANVIPVSNEQYEKLVSQGGAAGGWVTESAARPETATPTLVSLKPYFGEVYANPAVTQKLLDDSGFDVEAFLAEEVGTIFAEYESTAFTTGDGVNKPRGFLTYTLAASPTFGQIKQIKSGSSGAVVADKLIEVSMSLKPRYLQNAAWMMSQATLLAVRTLKNPTTNDYLLRVGIERGAPATLLGYPVILNEDMPDPAADANAIAFADWKRAYKIADVRNTRILRDPYTAKPKVHFYTTRRTGGMVEDSTAIVIHTLGA